MNARRLSSSSARHCRRSHEGGAKLAYRSGTMARATSSITTCVAGWRTNEPTEIANSRRASSPPNPRLSERKRHACTEGSCRATSQNRTMGSTTQSPQTANHARAMEMSHGLGATIAPAARSKTLAIANEVIAKACQRRGRGIRVSR